MKFRKKTMTTILAAVLIAMIGVMPALATNPEVTLQVTVAEIISITITDPTSPVTLDFGTPIPGVESDSQSITITNTGNVAVYITHDVTGDASAEWYTVTDVTSMPIAIDATSVHGVTVTVPVDTLPAS